MSEWWWIMVCYDEPVVVNHGVLFWASDCESCCVIRNQWLWIIVCYADPVVVNHGELWWTSGCESWCVMLSQWLCIMVCYSEPVIVNHVVFFWAIVSYADPVVVNHGVLGWGSDCESCCVILSKWLWIMVNYVVKSGCESWCAIGMLSTVVENHGVLC
jgi:hypothetical protein